MGSVAVNVYSNEFLQPLVGEFNIEYKRNKVAQNATQNHKRSIIKPIIKRLWL